ncbi:hypothetical protein OG900_33500 [Streptomyces sp. NBC_00433]
MTTSAKRTPPCDTCPCPAWGLECTKYRAPTQSAPIGDEHTARGATFDLRERIAFELYAAGGPFTNADAETLADAVLPLMVGDPEAHPPIHRWRVEHVDGDQWVPGSGLKTDRAEAVHLLNVGNKIRPLWADGTPVQRRLVRETTSYAVEDALTLPADQDRGGQ